MIQKIFIGSFLAILFLSGAPSVRAEYTNLLPTGMVWRAGNAEILFSEWSTRDKAPVACTYSQQPKGCMSDVYDGKISQSQCRLVENPDKCSTNVWFPADVRSQAKCTTVRIHTSAQDYKDERDCAVCSGGSCNFYIGMDSEQPKTPDEDPETDTPPEPDLGDGTGPKDSTTSGPEGDGTGTGGTGDTKLVNLSTVNSIPELLEKVLSLLVQVGTILLVFFLILTGFKFVAAQGNPGAIEEARTSLTWVVIGGMLLLGAQALSMVIAAAVTSL
jgi:hypothetical protein